VERRREVCEWAGCVCVRNDRDTLDVKVGTKGCVRVDNVPDLTFELGVKSSAVEEALVLVVLCRINS
jgi:hypothetical protein